VRLDTHLVVREDGWSLYGFPDAEHRALFQQLLGVGGVGPKLALGLLAALTPQQVALAVGSGDAALLATAPGVGKRTAERLVVELKGKLPEALEGVAGRRGPSVSPAAEDAVAALVALGYRESTVRAAIADLAAQTPDAGPEVLIRKALAPACADAGAPPRQALGDDGRQRGLGRQPRHAEGVADPGVGDPSAEAVQAAREHAVGAQRLERAGRQLQRVGSVWFDSARVLVLGTAPGMLATP
jgi:holliday junction DNA helicase RuvA